MGGKPSISVRDLKFKILHKKKLDIAPGFDLLFSDALTGQEYVDENFEISCGSSVIVKRLPAGTVLIERPYYDSSENFHIEETKKADASPPKNIGNEDLDDFGTELYPIPKSTVSGSRIDVDLQIFHQCKTQSDAARYFEPDVNKCNKIEVRAMDEATAKGPLAEGKEGEFSEESNIDCEENEKSKRIVDDSPLAIGNTKLPSWMKCLLCKFVLKDAMMIPCCQHNFCERCIRMVLLKHARCPKCNLTKCKAIDLLPNVSLRQAIQCFCESQLLPAGCHNILHPEVPDGESGIQMREESCNLTIGKDEPALSHS